MLLNKEFMDSKNTVMSNVLKINKEMGDLQNEGEILELRLLDIEEKLLREYENLKKIDETKDEKTDIQRKIDYIFSKKIDKILSAITKKEMFKFQNEELKAEEGEEIIYDKVKGILYKVTKRFPKEYSENTGAIFKYLENQDFNICKHSDYSLNLGGIYFGSANILKYISAPNIKYIHTVYDEVDFLEYFKKTKYVDSNVDRLKSRVKIMRYDKKEDSTSFPSEYGFDTSEYRCVLAKYIYMGENHENFMRDGKNTETDKAKFILEIFAKHKLIPILGDVEAEQIYIKIFIEKREQLEKIKELNSKIREIENQKKNEVMVIKKEAKVEFDYNFELKKYRLEEVEEDFITYYKALSSWHTYLLESLELWEREFPQLDRLKSFNNEISKIDIFIVDSEQHKQRKKSFKKHFLISLEEIYESIWNINEKAEKLKEEYEKAILTFNLDKIIELENHERPSFFTLAKASGETIYNRIKKAEEFRANLDKLEIIMDKYKFWLENYDKFGSIEKKYLEKLNQEDIEKEIGVVWRQDFILERQNLEKQLNELLEGYLRYYLEEDIFIKINKYLEDYWNQMENLYTSEIIAFHHEHYGKVASQEFEQLDISSKKHQHRSKFIENIEEIILNSENINSKRWLLKWAGQWMNISLVESLNLMDRSMINKISSETLNSIREMKTKLIEEFSLDIYQYADMRKKDEESYKKLLFKMKKELLKKQ